MKKIISAVLLLTIVAVALFACASSKQFTGEWKFSKIRSVEFAPDVSESTLDMLKEAYNAENEEDVIKKANEKLGSDKIFDAFYLKFDGKNAYTYDPFMDREATWVFYQTDENKGFISFYGELDVEDGNPDPVVCPEIVYESDKDTLYIVLNAYNAFMITLELTR